MGRCRMVFPCGKPFTTSMPCREMAPFFGTGTSNGMGSEELRSLLGPPSGSVPSGADSSGGCRVEVRAQPSGHFRSSIIGASATAPGGPALWLSGHGGPVEGSFAPDLFGGEAPRIPSSAGSSGSMPLVGVGSLGGCCRSRSSRRCSGFAAKVTRWGTGLSVPRVVRSSDRSTQLPASNCWMCPFPSRVHFVDTAWEPGSLVLLFGAGPMFFGAC